MYIHIYVVSLNKMITVNTASCWKQSLLLEGILFWKLFYHATKNIVKLLMLLLLDSNFPTLSMTQD